MTGPHFFDRVVALVALVLLIPLLVVIALSVRLTSPGPVIFRQVRIGQDGTPFRILKFRTMVNGADRLAPNVSPDGDPRVTSVGRWLRARYLDELPQLVNVLKGDMNLVGPRPETPEYVALYTPQELSVLRVRPGLAGPSTLGNMDEGRRLAAAADPVSYYRTVLLHERVQMDICYLEQKSLTYDLQILIKQVVAIVRSR
jgi:lipopolysaccharide/colanic/teichoic acid biosynthesis glycosyltransferase